MTLQITDRFSENCYVQWIIENGRSVLYIMLTGAALMVAVYSYFNVGSQTSQRNYIAATIDWNEFEKKKGEEKKAAFQRLLTLITVQPDLKAKYQGLMAQGLLIDRQESLAEPLFKEQLVRTEGAADPLVVRFAKTSFLIEKQQYAQALERTKELKTFILNDSKGKGLLLSLNLLRQWMLERELGLIAEAEATAIEWKIMGKGDLDHLASDLQLVASVFQEGNLNLDRFMEAQVELNLKE